MKKALCMVLALVLLLSGCNYNTVPGGGTEPSDILGSMPTNPTPAPTNPTTEPTAPTIEPTVFPTDYQGNDISEELIAEAAQWAQVTDYHAEIRMDKHKDYHVILDDGKYIYDFLCWPGGTELCRVSCTHKVGTLYPDGPALPPGDMTEEEFRNTYTILDEEIIYNNGAKRAEVNVVTTCLPNIVLDGVTIQTTDGKPIFCHHGVLYVWESETVFREIGRFYINMDRKVHFTLCDRAYAIEVNIEHSKLNVVYRTAGNLLPRALFRYDTNGATSVRLDVIDFDSAEVKCVLLAEDGEVELVPYDYHYGDIFG